MGKKVALLLVILVVLAGISGVYIAGGLQAYARDQQKNLASQQHCGGQLPVHICVQSPRELFSAFYPSYLATHTPQFMVAYRSDTPITLIISISIAGFTQPEIQTINATDQTQEFNALPLVQAQSLRKWTADQTTQLQVRVTDTHNDRYDYNDIPLLVHSRWLMQWVAANRLKIAAWVTPQDPSVAQLVLKAENYLPNQPMPAPNALIGYANNASPRQVRDQVDAIFDAMRIDYHIRYVQGAVPYSGPGDTSISLEYIKLPGEVLQQHSGMCIELTALLASAVERIGLHSEIVIIPGHAFLGVAVDPNNIHFEYWDAVDVNSGVAGDSANISADKEYLQYQKQLVDTIVISDARQQGIEPML